MRSLNDIFEAILLQPVRFFTAYFLIFSLSYALFLFTDLVPDPVSESGVSDSFPGILMLGILAGLLQLLGYILYLNNKDIDPNPVSWFMFAYGTAILTVLEWDALATLPELILPTVCAVLAVVVSVRCWVRVRRRHKDQWWPKDWWPEDIWERRSFVIDIAITVGYVASWLLATYALVTEANREYAVLVFLLLSNISTLPAFYPIVKETYLHPEREHWTPWTIWALAYVILALVTFMIHRDFISLLMLYPVSNAILHALVGWLARPSKQRGHKLPLQKLVHSHS